MSFLSTIPYEQAPPALREIYDEDLARLGYVANYSKAFSSNPQLMRAWQQLNASVKAAMDLRIYELVTLAAATAMRSTYCALAHGKVLAERFFSAAEVVEIAAGPTAAGLNRSEREVMAFARKVALNAASMGAADMDLLRQAGFSDAEIFGIAAAAAARCFFSKLLDATGTQADHAYLDLEPKLVEALTVGRPIGAE